MTCSSGLYGITVNRSRTVSFGWTYGPPFFVRGEGVQNFSFFLRSWLWLYTYGAVGHCPNYICLCVFYVFYVCDFNVNFYAFDFDSGIDIAFDKILYLILYALYRSTMSHSSLRGIVLDPAIVYLHLYE